VDLSIALINRVEILTKRVLCWSEQNPRTDEMVERFLPLLLAITAMKECKHMRIGVLEDDPAIRGLLNETLERHGHTPFIFRNGWDFLEQFLDGEAVLSRKPCDMVLIDLLLPSSISAKQTIH
jgi:hypothetical protein